jgi:hypothetical protein
MQNPRPPAALLAPIGESALFFFCPARSRRCQLIGPVADPVDGICWAPCRPSHVTPLSLPLRWQYLGKYLWTVVLAGGTWQLCLRRWASHYSPWPVRCIWPRLSARDLPLQLLLGTATAKYRTTVTTATTATTATATVCQVPCTKPTAGGNGRSRSPRDIRERLWLAICLCLPVSSLPAYKPTSQSVSQSVSLPAWLDLELRLTLLQTR